MEGAAPPASSGSEVTDAAAGSGAAASGKVDAGGGSGSGGASSMEERFADLCKSKLGLDESMTRQAMQLLFTVYQGLAKQEEGRKMVASHCARYGGHLG